MDDDTPALPRRLRFLLAAMTGIIAAAVAVAINVLLRAGIIDAAAVAVGAAVVAVPVAGYWVNVAVRELRHRRS